MSRDAATSNLYEDLLQNLGKSDGTMRKRWALQIAEEDLPLAAFLPILNEAPPTSTRFAWFLSGLGEVAPKKLYAALPAMFESRNDTALPNFERAFVTYWHLAGIPAEHEAAAVEISFQMLSSATLGVHSKTCALRLLEGLVKTYPDLKQELKLILEEEKERNTPSFKKRAEKLLVRLDGMK